MKLAYTLSGGQVILKQLPLYGNAANIKEGAAVMKGATAGTNAGFAILSTGANAGFLGVTCQLHTNTVAGADAKQDGTAYTYLNKRVIINPDAVYLVELAAPATAAIAVASVTTTSVVVTSLEDNLDGGWLWGSDYQMQYITSEGASDTAVTKTASGWTAATTLAKVVPNYAVLVTLSSDATKLQGAAAAGSCPVGVIESYIQDVGVPFQRLDPTKHSGVTFSSKVKIFQELAFTTYLLGNKT